MASAIQKFSYLLNEKCDNIRKEYMELLYSKYPFLKNNTNEDLYRKKEALFAQEHVDMKLEYYTLDCYRGYLEKTLAGISWKPFFDLLVSMAGLDLIENILNESNLSFQEKRSILKFYLNEYIAFFSDLNNERSYNFALAGRDNARFKYATQGDKPLAEYIADMTLIKDGKNKILASISEIESDFLEKHEIAKKCKEIIQKNGFNALYTHPELLSEFGLSKKIIEGFSKKENRTSINTIVKKYDNSKNATEDLSWVYEELKKYIVEEEFVGLIQGADLSEFISLASKVYSSKKVELLKEKLLLNNDRIVTEQEYKRKNIRNKILHEDDKIFYYHICDLDLTDQSLVPYVAQIQYTITTIEGLVTDLVANYDEELKELYLEETQELINNLRVCLPSIHIVL